jgi:capsular exopolysaccharide synthesis family protein
MTDLPVQVHERAIGAAPIGVSPTKIFTAAVAFALAAGIGITLGLHLLDHSIKTIDQAERLAGVPVLSAIPKKAKTNVRALDVVSDRKGIVAEAFRSLRTSLATGVKADHRRTFLFTSAMPSEGKTFSSSNFAATLSQQGFKTLIIDADLRKPAISRVFFGKRRTPGLLEVLTNTVQLSDAIVPSEIENLHVLTAGGDAPNLAELLSTPRWRDLLKEAALVYDRIVVDSAPVLAVSDSLLLAPHVDVTCLVIRSFKTPTKTVGRALKALAEIDCQPVGLVINFMPTGTGSYYYYSGKYYGAYGEKNVYGT